jgi:hypothetical protein
MPPSPEFRAASNILGTVPAEKRQVTGGYM